MDSESEKGAEPHPAVVVPIERDISGDTRERFAAEALSHRESIYHAAHRFTGNISDAEDLAQDTYVRALGASYRFQLGTDLRAWLFTILRNLYRNRRRNAARTIIEVNDQKVDQLSELKEGSETPEQALLKKAGNADLKAALESLPSALRDAVWLSDVEELPYAEIARRLRIPVGTVMSRVFRARQRLYERLTGHARQRHPVAPGIQGTQTVDKRSGTANRDSSNEG
jgi:RNA polymerase sigma-70 factor (ECF subfamily)